MDRWENRGRDRYRGTTRGRGYRDNTYFDRGRDYRGSTYTDRESTDESSDESEDNGYTVGYLHRNRTNSGASTAEDLVPEPIATEDPDPIGDAQPAEDQRSDLDVTTGSVSDDMTEVEEQADSPVQEQPVRNFQPVPVIDSVLQCSLLQGINYLTFAKPARKKPVPKPRTRQQTRTDRSTVSESTDESSDESEDNGYTVGYLHRNRTNSGASTAEDLVPEPIATEDPDPIGDAQPAEDQRSDLDVTTGSVSDDMTEVEEQADSPVQEQPVRNFQPVPSKKVIDSVLQCSLLQGINYLTFAKPARVYLQYYSS
ncbi:unnamed protein product [Mytilus coruscus]|uniref:Uncharacterized protein n=1 Tax=Mytilus coruscus TaxID=42192 RepID=A0A6J8BEL4_MYTCO|nr:unnamed protein product [Mytilus coruscus]